MNFRVIMGSFTGLFILLFRQGLHDGLSILNFPQGGQRSASARPAENPAVHFKVDRTLQSKFFNSS
jgi:hypothetical protein